MKKVLLIVVIVCILFLTGCAKTLNAGIVTDKKFFPAHKVYSPLIMRINNHTQITPRWIKKSECWFIYVQDGDNKDCWEVSKKYYDSVEIGDHIERNIK